uniref:Uncharacterized protein n=1 Tax=Arundo donax TaxID=35708 RepID=A0A0A8Y9J1_ARUDO
MVMMAHLPGVHDVS